MKFHYNNYDVFCSGLLMQILGIIQELLSDETLSKSKNIQKTINYIEKNYANDISIKKLAEIASLSESFFFKSFKKMSICHLMPINLHFV